MKKLLLPITIMLFGVATGFAQNRQAGSDFRTIPNNHVGNALHKNSGLAPVPTTTTSTCMSINTPSVAGWTPTIYGAPTSSSSTVFADGGFVNGNNFYLDKEKAMYFDASAYSFTILNQVDVWFSNAYTTTPTKVVNMKIYDGTSGTPSASVIATATVSMAQIMSDVSGGYTTSFFFPGGITIPASKKFFASVDVTNLQWTSTVHDSLNVVSNQDPQTNPAMAWEKQSNSVWYRYNNTTSSWGLNISLYIQPFLSTVPITASLTASSNTICAGQSVTYNSAGSTTGGSYYWSFGSTPTPTSATTATASATYPSAGTYTTYLVVADACSAYKILGKTITVNPTPTVSATPSSTTVCSGKQVVLSGGGATSYAWSGGITNGVAFTPAASGSYTVTGTGANSCTNSAVASVVVNPTPTVTANTSTNTVCSGKQVTLSGGGASTYVWTGGVTDAVAFTPASGGSYTVTGTAANGCTNTAVTSVAVIATPTVSATPSSTTVCSGANVTLNGGGASTYVWTGGISNGAPFAATSTTAYTVTGTAANGCTNTAVASVNVNALPSVVANASSTVSCAGSNVTLTGSGASTYTWTGGVTDGVAFVPSSTNTYTVSGTSAAGCINTATVGVTVVSNPTVTANTTATAVCMGMPVTLSGGGASTYTWTGGVTDNTAFTPSSTATYTVTGAAGTCSGSAAVTVVVNSNPTVSASATATMICSGANVTLNGSGASTYTWTGGATDNTPFAPAATDTYTVTGADANGCTGTATVSVVVSTCTGINGLSSAPNAIVLYPNPGHAVFTVSSHGLPATAVVEIYNNLGKLVYSENLTQENQLIQANLANGIYFVKVTDKGTVLSVHKFISQ
ncbi:MAG: T9SS type A sorting domain-containing protein [Bacteroidetes bacterium]|nr:T9SS type A sorting domain-containing protein [Bacteroidota bacterium]